jgi:16S rRNA (guanine527-N7)-methyltransferase
MEADLLRQWLTPYISSDELDEVLLASVGVHLDLLLRWNQRMNLTAVRTPEEMVRRHFGESLFAARHLLARDTELEVIDVGSGAGFPGLPLKFWAPGVRLTLVEGHGKKATFLREVGRSLGLTGFEVLNQRAEGIARRAPLVTMRAVEQFERSLAAAARLIAPGGRLALLIGDGQREEVLAALPAGESEATELPESQRRILFTWSPTGAFHVEQH